MTVRRRRLLCLTALFAWATAAQEANVVTGTAAYRERMALPPDAVFEATLEEAAGAGAPAGILGRARLENAGQPPFRFSIPYDPARIVEGRSYSVRALVTVRGNVLFATNREYPVLTQGRGNQVSMLLVRSPRDSPARKAGLERFPRVLPET